jgi:formiminotetrahydrofolate cyclodeaminase
MDDLAALSIDEFLDRVADRTPTPGGGGVAGLAGALACTMGRMVAAYSIKRSTVAPACARVESLSGQLKVTDQLLRGLITQDGVAYGEMTAARKALQDGRLEAPAYHNAVLRAIAVPMEMSAAVSRALAAMDAFKVDANPYLLSDLGVAAVLAHATARAASYSVRINVAELTDEGMRERIVTDVEQTVQRCTEHCDSIEAYVRGHLGFEDQGGPGR